MTVGGIDTVLLAPAGECVGDLVLRACCRHWDRWKCIFQDGNDQATHSLDEAWVWEVGTASKEFFVYRDRAAAESWNTDGATAANANTMFHFIIGEPRPGDPNTVEVAFVCDKLTREVKDFIADLKTTFLAGIAGWKVRQAA
jgi:hypothetical protein